MFKSRTKDTAKLRKQPQEGIVPINQANVRRVHKQRYWKDVYGKIAHVRIHTCIYFSCCLT
jgi:hypothetical protein